MCLGGRCSLGGSHCLCCGSSCASRGKRSGSGCRSNRSRVLRFATKIRGKWLLFQLLLLLLRLLWLACLLTGFV